MQEGEPEVSVVLPFSNVASTLAEAMSSILAETLGLELVAIDDRSTDGSADVARSIAATDPRVRVVGSRRPGLVGALETGLAASRSPFVARMDGDDVSLTGRLDAQLATLRTDPSLAVVGGLVEAFPSPEGGLVRYVEWMNDLRTPDEHARDVFVEAPLCHPSTMIRRSALEAVGGYHDGAFAEDWDLWLRLDAAGHRLAKVDRHVLRWRHRAGRATFSDPRYSVEAHRTLRARHLSPVLRGKRDAGRALVTWGAGPTGRRLARAIEVHDVRFERFVDIDPKKIGRTTRGAPIVSMDALHPNDFVVVAVGSRTARELVRAELLARGRIERADFVCAA